MQKFSAPDPSPASGFIITDLSHAEGADGVVRCAKKVLVDGARTMARSRTYAWALLGQQRSGASAGISAAGERDAAMAAFLDAAGPASDSGTLVLDAAKGVGAEELDPLRAGDPRHDGDDAELLAASVAAAVAATPAGLDGRTVAIEGAGAALPALLRALAAAGARPTALGLSDRTVVLAPGTDPLAVATALGAGGSTFDPGALPDESVSEQQDADAVLRAEVDVLVCGSKVGLVDHDVASGLRATVLAPLGPVPVTAKGLAVAARNDVVVLPDFLTTAGPLQRFLVEGSAGQMSAATEAASRSAEFVGHAEGAHLGACLAAEAFLSSWCDELPFGRPLA